MWDIGSRILYKGFHTWDNGTGKWPLQQQSEIGMEIWLDAGFRGKIQWAHMLQISRNGVLMSGECLWIEHQRVRRFVDHIGHLKLGISFWSVFDGR